MKQIKWFVWVLFFLLMVGGISASNVKAQGNTNLVLAFYYAWYNPNSFNGGKTPFTNPNPYYSGDAMQRHVTQAKNAGIDALVQAWYGPDENNYTEINFKNLLATAAANGTKAALYFESGSPFHANRDERVIALRHAINNHMNHPAYLRVDGKPIIFFWANWLFTVSEWQYIRDQVDPWGNTIWIAEGGHTEYLSVFDGLHLYNVAWSANPAGTANTWAANTRAASATYGGYKYWVGTAMPGWDDTLVPGRGSAAFSKNRQNGTFYQRTFQGAAGSNPDILIITSFNEWPEGSHIEPSSEFGDYYLNLTKQYINGYKYGGGFAPPPQQPVVAPTQPPPTPIPPTPVPIQPAATNPPRQNPNAPLVAPTAVPSTAVVPTNPAPTVAVASATNQAVVNVETATPQAIAQTQVETATPFPSPTAVFPTAQPDGRILYMVQPGDTFITISEFFGVEIELLYAFNDLTPATAVLVADQPIMIGYTDNYTGTRYVPGFPYARIEPDGRVYHRVQSGDTPVGIAVTYGLTMEEFYQRSGLEAGVILQVNQEVLVARTPVPEQIGGSAADEVPTLPPTFTPVPTLTPLPTLTITPMPTVVLLPTITPEPTETIAVLPTPVSTPVLEVVVEGDGERNGLLVGVFAGIIALLLFLGGLLIYMGRRK